LPTPCTPPHFIRDELLFFYSIPGLHAFPGIFPHYRFSAFLRLRARFYLLLLSAQFRLRSLLLPVPFGHVVLDRDRPCEAVNQGFACKAFVMQTLRNPIKRLFSFNSLSVEVWSEMDSAL